MVFETAFQCPSTSSGDSGVSRGFDAQELREIWRVSNPTVPPPLPSPSRLVVVDKDDVMNMKCVLVGDGTIGKTSMIVSYTTNGYPMEYVPTAFDNYSVVVTVDSQPISLQLCDTAGQDDFDAIRPLCYPNTDIFLLCFSVVNPTSFHNIAEKWLPEIQRHNPSVPIILVGTQCDLRDNFKIQRELARFQEQPVTEGEALLFAEALGAVDYIECSALTQRNLKEVFDTAILAVLDSHLKRTLGRKNKGKRKSNRKKYQFSQCPDACLTGCDDYVIKDSRHASGKTKRSRGWRKFCCCFA